MIFTLSFGGNILDGLASFLTGVLVKMLSHFLSPAIRNQFAGNVFFSACVGFAAWTFCRLGMAHSLDKVIIGNIMLLIPGLAMINGMKDLIQGEMLTGLLRLTNALVQAAAIAIGVALVLIPLG